MVGGFSQDIVTRIVDVQWGEGGPFVAADNFAHVFYGIPLQAKPPSEPPPPPEFTDLGTLEFHWGSIYGGACGEITKRTASGDITEFIFVLVGNWVNDAVPSEDNQRSEGAMIMASKDGQHWQVALRDFNFAGGRDDNFYQTEEVFYGAVYQVDEHGAGKFYAASYYNDSVLDETSNPHTNEGEKLYVSTDGFSWSKIGEQMHADSVIGTYWPVDAPSLIASHCTKPQNEGKEKDKKIPDGLQGYSKGTDTLIKPFSLDYYSIFGTFYSSSISEKRLTIKRNAHGEHPVIETAAIAFPCYCAGINGNIGIVGGGVDEEAPHGRIDASFDSGETWTKSFTPEQDESEADGVLNRRMTVILAKTQPPASPP